jgi:hypothetical protein
MDRLVNVLSGFACGVVGVVLGLAVFGGLAHAIEVLTAR